MHGSGQPSICAKLYRTNCEDRDDYIPGQSLVRRIGQRMSKPSDNTTCLAGLVDNTGPSVLANTAVAGNVKSLLESDTDRWVSGQNLFAMR